MNASVQQPVDIAKRVEQYVKLRDKIKEIKDRHSAELKPFADALEKLNGVLLDHLNQVNMDSASVTGVGTVYRTAKKSASLADADAFMRFVIGSEAFELLDRKANVKAVEDFIEANNGAQPPGVNFNVTYVAGVRRK